MCITLADPNEVVIKKWLGPLSRSSIARYAVEIVGDDLLGVPTHGESTEAWTWSFFSSAAVKIRIGAQSPEIPMFNDPLTDEILMSVLEAAGGETARGLISLNAHGWSIVA